MSWLGRALRPLFVVASALAFLFAVTFGGGGCGRSSFDDDSLGVGPSDADPETSGDADPDVVLPDDGTLTAIVVEPSSLPLPVGGKAALRARGFFSTGEERDLTTVATWSSDNPGVASIASPGVVSANSGGTARIRASFMGLFGEADVIVTATTLTDLRIDPSFAELTVGGSERFSAIALFSDGSSADVTFSASWSVDDSVVAKVSSGFVSAVSPGATTLRATFSGRTAFAKISVTGRLVKSIEISPFSPTVAVGGTVGLRATAIFTDGTSGDVTTSALWDTSDKAIVSLNTMGALVFARGEGAGVAKVTASFGGAIGSTPVTVTGSTLTSVTVTPATSAIAAGATTTLKATASYSDGSTVDVTPTALWRSSAEPIATVSSGVVRGVSPGTAIISATFGGRVGNATVTVSPAKLVAIAISPNPATAPLGSRVTLVARGSYDDGSTRDLTADVTWSTTSPMIATVSNAPGTKGQVTPIAVGSTPVRATLSGVTGNGTINVTAAALTKIAITPDPLSLVRGTRQFARATGTYSDGATIDVTTTCTWSTDDTSIAAVSNGAGSQGQVTANGVGSTALRCTQAGVTGLAKVVVTAPALEQVTVAPIAPTCRVGDVLQFQATAISTGGTASNVTGAATWSSSNPMVLTYLGSPGRFRCAVKGSATVTATYSGKSGSTPVTVSDAVVTSLQVDPINASLAVGATQQFQATAFLSDGTSRNVTLEPGTTWSSSSTAVASISNGGGTKGRATALSAGTTTIRATFAGVSGAATLKVTSATITSISINPAFATVPSGVTFGYTATAIYSDGTSRDVTATATWLSSNGMVAAVSNALGSKGQAQTFTAGTTTVTATQDGVSGKATLTVSSAKLVAVQVTPFKPTLPIGFGVRLTATAVWDDGFTANVTGQATWVSSNTAVASVSNALGSKGRVTPIAAGKANISATYNGVTGSTEVTVTSATLASIAITPNPAGVSVGGSQQLTARGTFSDGSVLDVTDYVGWLSSDPSTADVSNAETSKGVVFGFKPGTATVTATRGATSAKATVTVK